MSHPSSSQQQGCHCPEFVRVYEQLFTVGEYCLQLKDNGECYVYCCHQFQLEELFFSLDLEHLRKQN